MSHMFQLTTEQKMMEILAYMVSKFENGGTKSLRYIHVSKISLEKKDVLYMFLFFFMKKGTTIHFSSDDVSSDDVLGEIVKILQYIGVKFTFPCLITNKNGDLECRRLLQEKVTIPGSEIKDRSVRKGYFMNTLSAIIDSWHKFSMWQRWKYDLFSGTKYENLNNEQLYYQIFRFKNLCSIESAEWSLKTIHKYIIHKIVTNGYESFPKSFDKKDDLEKGIDSQFPLIERNLHLSSVAQYSLRWLFHNDAKYMFDTYILMNTNWKAFKSMELLLELMKFNIQLITDDALKNAVDTSVKEFVSIYQVQIE